MTSEFASNGLPRGEPVPTREPMPAPTETPLVGAEVGLRTLEPATDAPTLFNASHGDAATEALWTYMPYGPFADVEAMQAWLADCAAGCDPAFRAVVERGTDRPVGMAAWLNIEPAHHRLELGHIWYAPRVQRGSVNTETIRLMLGKAFDRLAARRVEWKCDALNARSRAAASRLGFRFEGVFRQHMIVKGRNRDTAWYALVDRDWPAVRANMDRWLDGDETGVSLTALNAPLVAGFHDPGDPTKA